MIQKILYLESVMCKGYHKKINSVTFLKKHEKYQKSKNEYEIWNLSYQCLIKNNQYLKYKGKWLFFRSMHKIFRTNELCKLNLGEQQCQSKFNKLEPGCFTLWKCYIQGVLQKEECRCFFYGAPTFSRINYTYTFSLGKKRQIKIKKKVSEIFAS